MTTLQRLYGRQEVIINALLKQLRNVPAPRADDLKTLIRYGMAVQNLVEHMIVAEQQHHLSNPMLLYELVERLPPNFKLEWANYKRTRLEVNLVIFAEFMTDLVAMASDVTMYVDPMNATSTKLDKNKRDKHPREKLFVHHTETSANQTGKVKETSTEFTPVKTCTYWNSKSGSSKSSDNISNIAHQNHHFMKVCSLLRYIPITLYANGIEARLFAFLDDGSTSTIIEAEVAEQLGVVEPEEPLHLCWTGDVMRVEEKSQRIQLNISGTDMKQQYPLTNVRTVKHLKLPSQTLNIDEICNTHQYLKGLPITSYFDVRPKIIIGVDNATLISTLKLREGSKEGLIASKTRLGWGIYGRHSGSEDSVHLHLHSVQETRVPDNATLHDLMRQFFNIEESCVTTKPESEKNKRATEILEQTTVRVPTGYEVGLLWNQDEYKLPNTYPLALRRLKCLEKRLLRNPHLYAKVREIIENYVEKGYAHRASKLELELTDDRKTWYLPLGVVQNPKKPNKVRLIWDAAAAVEGLSFNDLVLKGPDMMASLIAVLIKFRERNVAIGGDLREMFHQIMIRAEDRQFLRFYGEITRKIRRKSQFVKNKNAEEFSEEFPRAAKAVIDNHYVDDYLDSVDTAVEA
ncbi:uncharacterized protein LOC129766367 [Toxorhynchites rutilus septentrionalis]|uniref:uncharacterized protein LOC129766367 n=1 Tax=Toxorhynchites rutilus septentrionalis TaxID=329112 RepID=UPI002479CBCC|nr:uncharacterized protein LOC129766367 [Toxorhynchites rutilus septentrionalis]